MFIGWERCNDEPIIFAKRRIETTNNKFLMLEAHFTKNLIPGRSDVFRA